MGIQDKEDPNTDLLAYCFKESARFREIFLKTVCGVSSSWQEVSATTRVGTGESGIPDLVIVCRATDRDCLIVIENKLSADEGKDQTSRYSSSACQSSLFARFDLDSVRTDVYYVFFTRFPDQDPTAGTVFRTVHHYELANALDEFSEPDSVLVEILARSWADIVQQIYRAGQLNEEDEVLARLRSSGTTDGSYLYFRSLFCQLSLPSDLTILKFYKTSQQGRRYFGALISKPHWHPSVMYPQDKQFRLDPDTSFHIHFEPQFNVLSGSLNLYIHYEVNPYQTKPWVLENVHKADYAGYVNRRNRFVDALKPLAPKSLILGGGSNQIAKVPLSLDGVRYAAFKKQLEGTLAETSDAIDHVLACLE